MSGGPAPLRFVGLVVLGWMGVRVAILVPDWAPDVPAADVTRAGTAAAPKQAQPPLMYTPRPVLLVSAPGKRSGAHTQPVRRSGALPDRRTE
jgi:hypothetical protein